MDESKLFGIAGLTPGGLGIWVAIVGAAAAIVGKWIAGMPERRRAATEELTVEGKAASVLFEQMRAEIERMAARMVTLEARVDVLEQENRSLIGERDAALADNARLRAVNDGQGEVRQQVARLVAADRLEDRAKGAKS